MVTIVQTNRAGPVLSPIAMPCQRGALTVNATRGCAHGCVYCYARDYRGTPLEGGIHLYSNLAQRLEEELARGRRRPSAIRFSTASDPFQPLAPVQEATYQATEVLLRAGFRVSFLTKGAIPEPFYHLLAQHPGQVYAQVGLCSLDPLYQQVYEPGAAPPGERLRNIQRLLEIGVPVETRLDPLIPGVTDQAHRLAELLAALAGMGINRAVASYMMLRPAIARRLKAELAPEEAGPLLAAFQSTPFQRVAASEHTQLLPAARRAASYRQIRAIAREFGIALTICRCKNPELGTYCHAGEEAYWQGSGSRVQGPGRCVCCEVQHPISCTQESGRHGGRPLRVGADGPVRPFCGRCLTMSTIDPGQLILRLSIAMMVAYLLVGAPYIAIARYGAKHPNPNWGLIKTLSTITLAFGMGAMAVVIGSLWGPWWLTLLVAAYTAALGGAVGFAMSVPTIKKARATREQYEKLGVRRPSVKLWDVFRLPPTVRGHARGVWKLGAAYGYLAVFLVLEYQFPSLGISSGQGMGYWVLPLLLWSALSAIVGWRGMIVAYPSPATDQWHVVWAIHGLSLFPSSLGVIIALTLNAITEAQFLNALSAVLLPLGHFFVASRWRAS